MIQMIKSIRGRVFFGILSGLFGFTLATSVFTRTTWFLRRSLPVQGLILYGLAILFASILFFIVIPFLWSKILKAWPSKNLITYIATAFTLGFVYVNIPGFTPVPSIPTIPLDTFVIYQFIDALNLFTLCTMFFVLSLPRLRIFALTMLLLVVNAVYFYPYYIPGHDSGQSFQIFHYLYDGFFFNHTISQWDPYQGYGLWYEQTLVTITSLSSWFMMAIGSILKVTDSLLLYKLSILCQQFVFLLGLYLFSGLVFKDRSTIFLVCIAGVTTTIWVRQLYFDWNIYYLMPLVLYLLTMFFMHKGPEYFWLAGITGVIWSYGSIYLPCLWIFVFGIYVLVWSIHNMSVWIGLKEKTYKNIACFTIFVFITGCYGYLLRHSTESLLVITPGRDPVTLKLLMHNFLTYGGAGLSVLPSLIFGWPTGVQLGNTELIFYTGLLCLPFFIWGAVRERSRVYLALLTATLAVTWLAQGGLFAAVIFYIPVVNYFRHLGYLYGLIKIMLILCAGFGWDNFWLNTSKRLWLLYGFVLFLLTLDFSNIFNFHTQFINAIYELGSVSIGQFLNETYRFWPIYFSLRVAGYLGLLIVAIVPVIKFQIWSEESVQKAAQRIKALLLVALLFDTLLFQLESIYNIQVKNLDRAYYESSQVYQVNYQEQRKPAPPTTRQQQSFELLLKSSSSWEWVSTMYGFAHFDTCNFGSNKEGDVRYSMISKDVQKLLDTRASIYNLTADTSMQKLLGCTAPKIRLMTSALYVENDEQALQLVKETPVIDQILVLTNPGIEMQQRPLDIGITNTDLVSNGTASVTHFEANRIIIDSNVTAPKGAWLVYADAWHPDWQAIVNEKPVRIYKAYGAFKAVWLEKGHSLISFELNNRVITAMNWGIFVTGVIFYTIALGVFALLLFPVFKGLQNRIIKLTASDDVYRHLTEVQRE